MRHLFVVVLMLMSSATMYASVEAPEADTALEIVHKLTLEEKIGQLIMMAVPIDDEAPNLQQKLEEWHWPKQLNKLYAREMLEKHHIGSVLYIMDGTVATNVAVANFLNTHNKSQLPLLFAADFEPGLNFSRIKNAVPFPRAQEWGNIGDAQLLYDLGRALGDQARILGIQVIFAPVVDVNSNPDNPVINTRAFGDTPEKVITYAESFMRGVHDAGILPVLKHAPGHGNTKDDSHNTLPKILDDRAQLDRMELAPFRELIKRGARAIMTGHLHVPAIDEQLPTSLSSRMIKDLLQKELGFSGIVFSDALNMRALLGYGDSSQHAVMAFKAGTHQLVGLYDVSASCAALKQAVEKGDISQEELDHRVAAIIRLKLTLPKPTSIDPEFASKEIAGPAMYAVLDRLRQKQVIEKNLNYQLL